MIDRAKIDQLLTELGESTKLVAVSKFKSNDEILEAFNYGIKEFGENRAQELAQKMEQLPSEIKWHFIGHLQRNKVKMIIEGVHLIHSVDSERLLRTIDSEAKKRDRVVDVLLQLYIAQEESKQGLTEEELMEIVQKREKFTNIRICGVMGMASFTQNRERVSQEFKTLKRVFDQLKGEEFAQDGHFKEISMGMSGDYQIALEEGSTMVRIGSLIFGAR